jgi:hypothetical protein
MTITAYPLAWPPTFDRTRTPEKGKFQATLAAALRNVQESLRLFAKDSETELAGLVISSNVTLGAQRPEDPGVAVWFTWGGLQVCIPVDRYTSVEGNLQAIHHIIEARRVELRHGTLALVRASFAGFLALDGPSKDKPWYEVLGVNKSATRSDIDGAYMRLRSKHHPDKGGDPEMFQKVREAYEEAMK